MPRNKLLIVCIYLVPLLALQSTKASFTPITNQYLGSQNHGDEHVLLFKLPQSMSSQMQELLDQQWSAKNLKANEDNKRIAPVSGQQSNQLHYPTQQQEPDQATRPSISLTIPLAAVSNGASVPTQAEVIFNTPTNVERGRTSENSYSAPGNQLESSPTFLEENNGVSSVSGLEQYGGLPAETSSLRSYEPEHKYPPSYQRPANNTTSALMQQLLAQQQSGQYTDESQSGPNSNAYPPNMRDSQLWRDTQGAFFVGPANNQEVPSANSQIDNELNRDQNTDTANLMAKLASSSPELLLRLRSLLRRAAQHKQHQVDAHNNTSFWTTYRKNGDQDDRQQQLEANNQKSLQQEHSSSFGGNQDMLNKFLTSTNLTSHEEIKVPFIVIAMPRFLSLKKNLFATTPVKKSSNSSPSYSSSQQLASATGQGASNNLSTDSQANLNPPMSQSTASNYTNEANSTSNQNPYHRPTSGLGGFVGYSPLEAQQMHPISATTSVPQHTMAPYAQQFNAPSEIPSEHPYGSHELQQQPPQSQSLKSDANQQPKLEFYHTRVQREQVKFEQQQPRPAAPRMQQTQSFDNQAKQQSQYYNASTRLQVEKAEETQQQSSNGQEETRTDSYHNLQAPSSADAGRSNLLHDQINNLKPLFQTNQVQERNNQQHQDNKLESNQMLGLLARSIGRQTGDNRRRFDHSISHESQVQWQIRSPGAKKRPEMLFMIV